MEYIIVKNTYNGIERVSAHTFKSIQEAEKELEEYSPDCFIIEACLEEFEGE